MLRSSRKQSQDVSASSPLVNCIYVYKKSCCTQLAKALRGTDKYWMGAIWYWMGAICTGRDPYVLDGSDMHWMGSIRTGWDPYVLDGIHMHWMGSICTGWDPYVLDGSDMHWMGSICTGWEPYFQCQRPHTAISHMMTCASVLAV